MACGPEGVSDCGNRRFVRALRQRGPVSRRTEPAWPTPVQRPLSRSVMQEPAGPEAAQLRPKSARPQRALISVVRESIRRA
jgi:hypothetical protein